MNIKFRELSCIFSEFVEVKSNAFSSKDMFIILKSRWYFDHPFSEYALLISAAFCDYLEIARQIVTTRTSTATPSF